MSWSQREAAIATEVPLGVWQGMELGRGTRGVDRHIAAIAANTGYDRDWLMWGGPLLQQSTPQPAVPDEGREVVRREGIEPPTRCVIEELEVAQLAEVLPFPLWKTRRSPNRVPLTLVPTTAVAS